MSESTEIYDEQIPMIFADLLLRCTDEYGAPIFAADMAEKGAKPQELRIMAARWREGEFEPASFAGELDLFADQVQTTKEEG